jgi:hypothetical protein
VSVGGEWVVRGEERLFEFVHKREWFGSVREEKTEMSLDWPVNAQ